VLLLTAVFVLVFFGLSPPQSFMFDFETILGDQVAKIRY